MLNLWVLVWHFGLFGVNYKISRLRQAACKQQTLLNLEELLFVMGIFRTIHYAVDPYILT